MPLLSRFIEAGAHFFHREIMRDLAGRSVPPAITRSSLPLRFATGIPLAAAFTLKRGYLTGAPGVLWKPPNSFPPSGKVTVRAFALLLPSFAP